MKGAKECLMDVLKSKEMQQSLSHMQFLPAMPTSHSQTLSISIASGAQPNTTQVIPSLPSQMSPSKSLTPKSVSQIPRSVIIDVGETSGNHTSGGDAVIPFSHQEALLQKHFQKAENHDAAPKIIPVKSKQQELKNTASTSQTSQKLTDKQYRTSTSSSKVTSPASKSNKLADQAIVIPDAPIPSVLAKNIQNEINKSHVMQKTATTDIVMESSKGNIGDENNSSDKSMLKAIAKPEKPQKATAILSSLISQVVSKTKPAMSDKPSFNLKPNAPGTSNKNLKDISVRPEKSTVSCTAPDFSGQSSSIQSSASDMTETLPPPKQYQDVVTDAIKETTSSEQSNRKRKQSKVDDEISSLAADIISKISQNEADSTLGENPQDKPLPKSSDRTKESSVEVNEPKAKIRLISDNVTPDREPESSQVETIVIESDEDEELSPVLDAIRPCSTLRARLKEATKEHSDNDDVVFIESSKTDDPPVEDIHRKTTGMFKLIRSIMLYSVKYF